ncbi:triose-phosphate isomerase [Acetobacter tropicalis]|uniref:Triosephosphate isomerase n=1 Tax=Acetobacter tropicalis TaxID=104102 RepID=A0A095AXC3_9PROT|nr:triose-phosphate isomerase [Acetobacter tropicalis]KAA8389591.1 triose-phosphate isomerase [Acetobacter tropicalis]KAA8390487.1 triose-phosphate isomerase [Acetobacter tropicalis]KGB21398.1 Triosephosphate isomerase [Acetobacter tropicalis]MBC9008478.1 triose-phosphate isomerase [Acetobacter tropicalis]MDO8170173.1 triose-phosphate isomerase [Acetobacter tropicalis]
MSRQIIVGNWKMNGTSRDSQVLVQALLAGLPPSVPDVVVCPPFTQLALLSDALKPTAVALGAQDCHKDVSGAHTGDISASMLTDLGVSYVILGHSERRQEHGELDETVREKAVAAGKAGLTPIVCIGETEDQRDSGEHFDTLGWQIKGSLPDGFSGILAYEPIWAIGTGRAATTDEIAETMKFLREELVRQFGEAGKTIRILYGGSVNDKNAASILAITDVAGALVGGASLKAEAFLSIIGAASAA